MTTGIHCAPINKPDLHHGGRSTYLALDPAPAMYKPVLTTAAMAMHTGQRVYATVQSRTAVVSTLSVATEENSLQ